MSLVKSVPFLMKNEVYVYGRLVKLHLLLVNDICETSALICNGVVCISYLMLWVAEALRLS